MPDYEIQVKQVVVRTAIFVVRGCTDEQTAEMAALSRAHSPLVWSDVRPEAEYDVERVERAGRNRPKRNRKCATAKSENQNGNLART